MKAGNYGAGDGIWTHAGLCHRVMSPWRKCL